MMYPTHAQPQTTCFSPTDPHCSPRFSPVFFKEAATSQLSGYCQITSTHWCMMQPATRSICLLRYR